MYGEPYTAEQVSFIADNIEGRSYAELTEMFNVRFGASRSCKQIMAAAKNRGLCNGRDTRIKPGSIPHNKGKPGNRGWKSTQFKKGNIPHTYRPVGSERVNRDGYLEVKTADPRTWKPKHLLVWEKTYGPIPKGCAVIFADGDRKNIRLNNLLLVSRAELAMLNKFKSIHGDAKITEAALALMDLRMEIGRRSRETKRRKGKSL